MFSAFALFISFLLGGLTLLPLLLAVFLGFLFYTSPVIHLPRKTGIPSFEPTPEDDSEPFKLYRAGWLTVRRSYEPLLITNDTYVGMITSGYRSFMDNRSRDPRRSKPKDQFYGVLKQNTLFLYDNEEQVDCWAAIDVSAHEVIIYPEGNLDGELFVKRNSLTLVPKLGVEDRNESLEKVHQASDETTHDMDPGRTIPWFIFARVNSDKEDWYHSLVQASKLGHTSTSSTFAKDRSLFDPDDMARLVDGIDQQPDSIPMRWFNALLGRIFLAVYRTSTLEDYITSRIVRKLKRVKTPSMLSEVQVREVNVGSAVPFFSKPMLKELTAEGDASMEVHLSYVGYMRITIETVATINLGSRFKPYSVRLVLAVVLKEIEGTLLFKIKRPPSNRIWFGFTTMPRMVLSVEPVVSTRQIKWSMITSPIESRIREVIMESIVVPHMDDLSFFNSRPFFSRGGIWSDALRKEHHLSTPAGAPSSTVDGNNTTIGTEEPVEEESIEPVPGVGEGREGEESLSSATAGKEGTTTRIRTRRRRSSEGDQSATTNTTGDSATTSSLPKTSSTSSLSSSFSLWRDSTKTNGSTSAAAAASPSSPSSSSSTAPTSGAGAGDKRRMWFGSGRSPSTSSRSPSSSSPARGGGAGSTESTTPTSTGGVSEGVEVSAGRLRDILQQRARSREREREREEQQKREGTTTTTKEEDDLDPTPGKLLSGLSLTAPRSATDSTTHNTAVDSLKSDTSSLAIPLTESPTASLVALVEPVTNVPALPPFSTSSSSSTHSSVAPSTSSTSSLHTLPLLSSSTPETTSTLPPLPTRPSFTKTLPTPPEPSPPPPPPPPRHQSSHSVDSLSSSTSTASSLLLSSWRTKTAPDKQALAAGVLQAKESMKRWGATWNASRRAAVAGGGGIEEQDEREGEGDGEEQRGEASSPPQDGGRSVWSSEKRERSVSPSKRGGVGGDGARTPLGESYRDYRAGKNKVNGGGTGDYFPESTSTSTSTPSAPIAMAPSTSTPTPTRRKPSLSTSPGHFTPAVSPPTTKISPVVVGTPGSASTSTTSTPARAYKPAAMMVIPGIKDENRKKAVAEDHVSAKDEVGKKEETTTAASSTAQTSDVAPPPNPAPARVAPVIPPRPGTTTTTTLPPAVPSAPTPLLVDSTVPNPVDIPSSSSSIVPPPNSTPSQPTSVASSSAESSTVVVEDVKTKEDAVQSGSVASEEGDKEEEPVQEEGADEDGWGLDAELEQEVGENEEVLVGGANEELAEKR